MHEREAVHVKIPGHLLGGDINNARISTVMATCARQGRSVFDYLQRAVHAYFIGQPIPSLLLAQP